MPMVQFKKLSEDATVPRAMSPGAAGFDLYTDEKETVLTQDRELLSTGIAAAIPPGFVGFIWPRSGLSVVDGIDTGAGVVDADYRGEIKVLLFNHGEEDKAFAPGDRIAQLVVVPCLTLSEQVDDLPETGRGDHGFGSTGA